MKRISLIPVLALAILTGCASFKAALPKVGTGLLSYAQCRAEGRSQTACALWAFANGVQVPRTALEGWSDQAIDFAQEGYLFPTADRVAALDLNEGLMMASSDCPVSGCVSNCSAPPMKMKAALCGDPQLGPAWPIDSWGQNSSAGATAFHYNAANCSNYQSFARGCLGGTPGNYVSSRAFPPWSDAHARAIYDPERLMLPHDFQDPEAERQEMPILSEPFEWPHLRPICLDPWMSPYASWCETSRRMEADVFPLCSELLLNGNVGDGFGGELLAIDFWFHQQNVADARESAHLGHACGLVLACQTHATFCPFNFDRIGERALEAYDRWLLEEDIHGDD